MSKAISPNIFIKTIRIWFYGNLVPCQASLTTHKDSWEWHKITKRQQQDQLNQAQYITGAWIIDTVMTFTDISKICIKKKDLGGVKKLK